MVVKKFKGAFTVFKNIYESVSFLNFFSFSFIPFFLILFLFCLSFLFLAFFFFSPFSFLPECFSLLETDCIHCGDRCWLDTQGKVNCPRKLVLTVHPKKKSFLPSKEDRPSSHVCKMNEADQGTGALYIIMDAIKNSKANEKQDQG